MSDTQTPDPNEVEEVLMEVIGDAVEAGTLPDEEGREFVNSDIDNREELDDQRSDKHAHAVDEAARKALNEIVDNAEGIL